MPPREGRASRRLDRVIDGREPADGESLRAAVLSEPRRRPVQVTEEDDSAFAMRGSAPTPRRRVRERGAPALGFTAIAQWPRRR